MWLYLVSIFILCCASAYGDGGARDAHSATTNELRNERDLAMPRLLLLSVDGFRYDYIDMMRAKGTPLVHLERLVRDGVYASMKPQFPSETFVNHVSMMTGLYPTSHGVVGNVYYDSRLDVSFDPVHKVEQWYDERLCGVYAAQGDAEPLWYTNERQRSLRHPSRRSGVHLWPCAYRYRGAQPSVFESRFDNIITMKARIDRVLGWFFGDDVSEPGRTGNVTLFDGSRRTAGADGRPVNFAALYYEHVDETAHLVGPDAHEVSEALLNFDTDVGYLLDRVRALAERVSRLDGRFPVDYDWLNIVIVSDHGFSSVDSTDNLRAFKLSRLISTLNDDIPRASSGFDPAQNRLRVDSYNAHSPFAAGYNLDLFESSSGESYIPSDEDLGIINSVHPALHAYRVSSESSRFSVPSELRFTAPPNSLVAPRLRSTLLLTEPGFLIENDYVPKRGHPTRGTHGYSQLDLSMRAILVARGPAFRVGFHLSLDQPIENVDLYPLLCSILGLDPAPNNGSFSRASVLLATTSSEANGAYTYALGIVTVFSVAVIICGAVLRHRIAVTQFSVADEVKNVCKDFDWNPERDAPFVLPMRGKTIVSQRGSARSYSRRADCQILQDALSA